jgi:hypothetical protein
MADEYVVNGLVKRRAEVAGEIENTQKKLGDLVEDLAQLDAVILQFDPSYQIQSIVPKAWRPPEHWSKRGEMTRVIMGILRQATEPMTTRDIAYQLLTERALDKNDIGLVRLMTKRVAVSMRDYRTKGVVRSIEGPGQYNLWEMVR